MFTAIVKPSTIIHVDWVSFDITVPRIDTKVECLSRASALPENYSVKRNTFLRGTILLYKITNISC